MLLRELWGGSARQDRDEAIAQLWRDPTLRDELVQVFELLDERGLHVTIPLDETSANPIRMHARYTSDESLIAFGRMDFASNFRRDSGVLWLEDVATDCFFVTLRKDEAVFSPSTRYHDYALSPTRFHWELQNRTRPSSTVGQRYVSHQERGTTVQLLVREQPKNSRNLAEPFTFLGPLRYESHQGSAPMQFVWQLAHPMPAELYEVARLVAG